MLLLSPSVSLKYHTELKNIKRDEIIITIHYYILKGRTLWNIKLNVPLVITLYNIKVQDSLVCLTWHRSWASSCARRARVSPTSSLRNTVRPDSWYLKDVSWKYVRISALCRHVINKKWVGGSHRCMWCCYHSSGCRSRPRGCSLRSSWARGPADSYYLDQWTNWSGKVPPQPAM